WSCARAGRPPVAARADWHSGTARRQAEAAWTALPEPRLPAPMAWFAGAAPALARASAAVRRREAPARRAAAQPACGHRRRSAAQHTKERRKRGELAWDSWGSGAARRLGPILDDAIRRPQIP